MYLAVMAPAGKIEVFGPIHQANAAVWMLVTALLALAWTAFILLLARRAVRRLHEQRARLDFAATYGGFGRSEWGGHQPVAVELIGDRLIVGRLDPRAKARIRRDLERRARAKAIKGRPFDAWRMN